MGVGFLDKIKEIIEIFKESSRDEIGISLLAYEQFICKGLKLTDKDTKKLSDVFDFYNQKMSEDFPSLVNEALQNMDTLICNYFSGFEKDRYKFRISYLQRNSDETLFDVGIIEKDTGVFVDEITYTITDKFIGCNYDKDSFNTTFKACQEIRKQTEKNDIEKLLKTFKL